MNTVEPIRQRIRARYERDPHVHISVTASRPRLVIWKQEATITGVFPHMFLIEAGGEARTVPYSDVLTGEITIDEIGPYPAGR